MAIRYFIKTFMIIAFLLCSNTVLSQSSPVTLKLLGQASIPYNHIFKETPIGGLSGLTYDSETGTYYVISDDRSNLAKARFYSFKLELNAEGVLERDGIRLEDVHYLRTKQDTFYSEGEIDPEDIALTSDSLLFISSEGVPGKNIAPFINADNKNGGFIKEVKIPEAYWSANNAEEDKQGVRNNLGFEALTASPDGTRLYTGIESALWQDGPIADATHQSPARIIIYDLTADSILYEHVYMVESVYYETSQTDMFSVNGLTALLALDNKGSLLALERNFVAGQGNRIALYAIDIQNAMDIKGVADLQQLKESPEPVKKVLIAYLNEFNMAIDNFEGLTFGPGLEDGGRLLLMVSDNNFSPNQETLFTAFRIKY